MYRLRTANPEISPDTLLNFLTQCFHFEQYMLQFSLTLHIAYMKNKTNINIIYFWNYEFLYWTKYTSERKPICLPWLALF